jgi:hypothetical protein
MLRRGKSRSSNRLSRQKSTSSVHSKQEYNDPEIARQQAQAAATYAYLQARARDSADTGRSAKLPKKTCASKDQDQYHISLQNNAADDQDQLSRHPSVRFAGPRAIMSRRPIGTRAVQNQNIDPEASIASPRPRALTNDVPVPAAYRPPSRSSSIGKASIDKRKVESIATALAYDEYFTHEDDIASTPSSYRRIRKSKSMLSPKGSSIFFNNAMLDSRTQDMPFRPFIEQRPPLRAPKSMSFVRRGDRPLSPGAREQSDATIQVARDKFLYQVEQQRLRTQPSFIFRSRAKGEERPFRKSVRTSSSNSYGMPVSSTGQPQKEGSLREKTRRASQTIKNKIKSLFRRSVGESEETVIPNQQVEARKSHDCGFANTSHAVHQSFADISCPDSTVIPGSQLPANSEQFGPQLRSRTGSIQSIRSDASAKSHVQSWPINHETVNSRHVQSDRGQQRLSIIQETGTHISSSTFSRPTLANQFSAYPAFHRPRGSNGHGPPVPTAVDGNSVYSALMKRLGENSPKAKLAQRMASVENIRPITYIPPRTNCANSPERLTPTIRQVPRGASNSSAMSRECRETITSPPHEHDDVFSPQPPSDSFSSIGHRRGHSSSSTRTVVVSRAPSYSAYPPLQKGDNSGLTPQQQADHNETLTQPAHSIRETRSTFFGNSTNIIRRTTSPYRRALAESDYNPAVITSDVLSGPHPSKLFLPPAIVTPTSVTKVGRGAKDQRNTVYSESVYSRSTSGQTPVALNSNISLISAKEDLSPGKVGSVVLVEQATYQATPPARRQGSSEGSEDWKNFLSSEVSVLDKAKGNDGAVRINYALPSMPKSFGHVREHAQINSEDTDIAQPKVSMSKQPLGILQNIQQPPLLKPILKNKSTTSLVEVPLPPPPPPPMPPLTSLRPAMSRSSLRSIATPHTDKTVSAPGSAIRPASSAGPLLLRTRSNSTLRSINASAKLVKSSRRPSAAAAKYSPGAGIVAAVEKQFGSASSRMQYSGAENHSPAIVTAADDGLYGSDGGTAVVGSDHHLDHQALGSKRMVDMFLSSRRRRVAGSDESNAFL